MRLKEIPEDFFVQELYDLPCGNGPYAYFLLQKRNWATLDALRAIADALHAARNRFHINGMKDKRAVTEQYVSGYQITKEQLEKLKIRDLTITFQCYGNERLVLGNHRGNFFRIVVRDLLEQEEIKPRKILNLFDLQRFGGNQKNPLIGKALLQGRFKDACALLALLVQGKDYLAALRKLSRRELRFVLNAYQSFLWNSVVQRLTKQYHDVPILGFLTEFQEPEIERVYTKLMQEEGITLRDFLTPSIPELNSDGGMRPMYVVPENFSVTWDHDDLHPGRWKATVSFTLMKGAYATQVVKELFKKHL